MLYHSAIKRETEASRVETTSTPKARPLLAPRHVPLEVVSIVFGVQEQQMCPFDNLTIQKGNLIPKHSHTGTVLNLAT